MVSGSAAYASPASQVGRLAVVAAWVAGAALAATTGARLGQGRPGT